MDVETAKGVEAILNHENIAIVVLMVMVLMESTMIYYLMRAQFKRFDKITDVLHKLHTSITVLNERLGHAINDNSKSS